MAVINKTLAIPTSITDRENNIFQGLIAINPAVNIDKVLLNPNCLANAYIENTPKLPNIADGNRTAQSVNPKKNSLAATKYIATGGLKSLNDLNIDGKYIPNSSLPVFIIE
jgi:hypothetical protein